MSVIPALPKDVHEPHALVEAIRARRGGTLLNLDCMLLHSPPLAEGWNTLLRAVRNEFDVLLKLREIAICVVAVINGADYEYRHHAPLLENAGATAAQIDALNRLATTSLGARDSQPMGLAPVDAASKPMGLAPEDASLFDRAELAVIHLAVEMTRSVKVSDATMASVRDALPNPRLLVEIVAVIAVYNMVSRFLVALDVDAES